MIIALTLTLIITMNIHSYVHAFMVHDIQILFTTVGLLLEASNSSDILDQSLVRCDVKYCICFGYIISNVIRLYLARVLEYHTCSCISLRNDLRRL